MLPKFWGGRGHTEILCERQNKYWDGRGMDGWSCFGPESQGGKTKSECYLKVDVYEIKIINTVIPLETKLVKMENMIKTYKTIRLTTKCDHFVSLGCETKSHANPNIWQKYL